MSDSPAVSVRPAAASVLAGGVSASRANGVGEAPESKDSARAEVFSKCLVILVALILLKLLQITTQAHSLYETHWRIGTADIGVINYFALAVFLFIGGWSLHRLGASCYVSGIGTVRAVNAAVLVLGISFILLTFHNGNKNYLYPVLSKVLKPDSLIPYLANSLFFNPPFLAGWLFAYVGLYYVLARTGRERWALSLTSLFAVTYALIFLRELGFSRDEVLIADCFGLISLLVTGNWPARIQNKLRQDNWQSSSSRRFSLNWVVIPLGWTLFFAWMLLRFDDQWHSYSASYFLGLVGFTFALFACVCLLVRRFGNPSAWTSLVPFFLVSFFLLTNSNYPCSGNYNHLLCLALSFPRYFAGDLSLVTLLVLGALAFRKMRPGGRLWWLDVAGILLILLAAIDLRLSQIMGVRLGWDVLAFGDSPKMMLRMAKPYLPGMLLALLVGIGLYAAMVRLLRTWSSHQLTSRIGELSDSDSPRPGLPGLHRISPGLIYCVLLFVALSALGVAIAESDKVEGQSALRLVRTSPLWKRVSTRTFSRSEVLSIASSLGLGDLAAPRATPTQSPRDLNVLMVFMESSYNKHLSLFGSSEDTQPLLSKYKERMELFPNFFSAFTGSIHARFATFTSLYPVQDFHAFTQERVPVKSLFEVFHDQGYTCSMFYSSYFDYTGFRDFLKNRGLDEMYDADTMPGDRGTERVEWGLPEEKTMEAIRNQLRKYAQSRQRFCLTYVPAAPHYPYDKIPKQFQKHKIVEIGDFTPRYLNELLYMDWILASIMDELKESGLLEHTLVIITNDHGEMLGGKDVHIGHGWAITPDLANTPLIVIDPDRPGFQVNKTIGTQVDLLPTILDRLHIPVPQDQLYEGLSLDAGPLRQDHIGYLNSYRQFGIISDDHVFLGDRESKHSSADSSGSCVFSIQNEGARTVFVDSADSGSIRDRAAKMAKFDSFQENLLHNYDRYRSVVRGNVALIAESQKRQPFRAQTQ